MKSNPLTMPHHVMNLIVSIILRQTQTFTKDEIYDSVEEKLKGTPFAKDGERRNEIDVKAYIGEVIETLYVVDYIRAVSETDVESKIEDFNGRYKLTMSFPSITRF